MPEGVIAGGWEYVIAAYAISLVTMIVYGISLRRRSRRSADEDGPHGS